MRRVADRHSDSIRICGLLAENKRGDRTRGVYIPNLIAESGPLLVLQPRASILCRRD